MCGTHKPPHRPTCSESTPSVCARCHSQLYGRLRCQKLSCWGPTTCFPMLSTSQTFLGLEPESGRMDSPPSTSCWESSPVALKLGRTPNVAQSALYRALIWRNNLGISTSAAGSGSKDVPEGEGLVRGNWAIVSNRTRMLWIARLVQNQRIRRPMEWVSMTIRTLPIFRWIRRSFSRSGRTLRRTRVLQTSHSLSRDRALGLRSAHGFDRVRIHLHTLHRRTLKAALAVVRYDHRHPRLFQVNQRFDIDVHPKTNETEADDQTTCDRHLGACHLDFLDKRSLTWVYPDTCWKSVMEP